MTSSRNQRTSDVIAFAIRNHIVISFQQSSFENTIVKSFQSAANHSDELTSVEKNSSKNEFVVLIIVASFRRIIVVSSKIEDSEFDDQIDYVQLRANQAMIEKRTIDKREYKLFVTRIRQLNTTSLRESEINSIDVTKKKRLRFRKSFNNDDNDTRSSRSIFKRARSRQSLKLKLKNLSTYYVKNIREYQSWIRNVVWIFDVSSNYFRNSRIKIVWSQQFLVINSIELWKTHQKINKHQEKLMMIWDYFSLYFHNCVESFETRRLDVDQKYNDVKQDKKFVNDFATYFESLKTKMNITKSSRRDKLLYDLNDSIRKLITFDVISSSIRQKVLIKVVNVERSSLYLFDRSTSIKNSFFEDRKRQKNRESIRNDFSVQLDKIKNDKIKKSDIDTSKRRSRACYNCDEMRHKQRDCLHSLKKTTTKINAIRKNKIKTLSRFIEVKSDSKNWENLS